MNDRAKRSRLLPDLDRNLELAELKSYLGSDYDEAQLRRSQEAVEHELQQLGDETELYRTSRAYLYDLTMFAMSGTKDPYLEDLTRVVPPPARILDYGCGIGSDGLRLLAAGYSVAFADFANPSVDYLRWRLAKRGFEAEIFDLDRQEIPPGYDASYAFDVIEHVEDPVAFLQEMERLADNVLVNFLEPDPDETSLHRPLPVSALIKRASRHRLRLYRVYHERSHLVLYGSDEARGAQRAASLMRLAGGMLRR